MIPSADDDEGDCSGERILPFIDDAVVPATTLASILPMHSTCRDTVYPGPIESHLVPKPSGGFHISETCLDSPDPFVNNRTISHELRHSAEVDYATARQVLPSLPADMLDKPAAELFLPFTPPRDDIIVIETNGKQASVQSSILPSF